MYAVGTMRNQAISVNKSPIAAAQIFGKILIALQSDLEVFARYARVIAAVGCQVNFRKMTTGWVYSSQDGFLIAKQVEIHPVRDNDKARVTGRWGL